MKITGAELTIQLLESRGIRLIAGIPGGANLPLYDALSKSNIEHVLARHEQGAGFIAQGMARSTGKAAVCFATSGPGIANMLTAIADAKLDSVPIIVISGQVPSALMGTDAFQELDTLSLTKSITKKNYLVTDAQDLLHVIPEAFTVAEMGRPGPVVIDIPKDIQMAPIEIDVFPEEKSYRQALSVDFSAFEEMARSINNAKRPVIYCGGGIVASNASEKLAELSRKNSIPLAQTLMALGSFPFGDTLNLGMLGMHGSWSTNHILEEADLLIALGTRFDDRATGKVREFCPEAQIIHIDIDPGEIGKIKDASIYMACDVSMALNHLVPHIQKNGREHWLARINEIRSEYPDYEGETQDFYNPYTFIRSIGLMANEDAIITTDVGQHQMWTAQVYPFQRPRTFLTSGGLGTMGFGLPAAIGAALGNRDRQVICFSGDGSIQMNIQELATLADLDLNVKILILNNQNLGLVRQQQDLFYDGNRTASRFDKRLNFAALAEQFGIRGILLDGSQNPQEAVKHALADNGPVLIDVPVGEDESVFPMVPPGAANREMIAPLRR